MRLLDRTSRRVSLTPAGQAFLDASRNVLAAADTAARTAQRAARSHRLVVAARPSLGSGLLATVLPRYDRSKDALRWRSCSPTSRQPPCWTVPPTRG